MNHIETERRVEQILGRKVVGEPVFKVISDLCDEVEKYKKLVGDEDYQNV